MFRLTNKKTAPKRRRPFAARGFERKTIKDVSSGFSASWQTLLFLFLLKVLVQNLLVCSVGADVGQALVEHVKQFLVLGVHDGESVGSAFAFHFGGNLERELGFLDV